MLKKVLIFFFFALYLLFPPVEMSSSSLGKETGCHANIPSLNGATMKLLCHTKSELHVGVSRNNRRKKRLCSRCIYTGITASFAFRFLSLALICVFIVLGFLACCVEFACSPGGCVCSLWVLPPTVQRHRACEVNEQIQIGRRCERERKRLLVFLCGLSINWQLEDGSSALSPAGTVSRRPPATLRAAEVVLEADGWIISRLMLVCYRNGLQRKCLECFLWAFCLNGRI